MNFAIQYASVDVFNGANKVNDICRTAREHFNCRVVYLSIGGTYMADECPISFEVKVSCCY